MSGCGYFGGSGPKPISPGMSRPGEGGLSFETVTLKQTDANGQLLWQIKAQAAVYSQDQKIAQVKNIDGELFQAGKPVFTLKAEEGEIQPEGQRILLKGKITATDTQSGAILKGQEVEWLPKTDLLVVRQNLQVVHPQVRIAAKEARASSRTHQIEAQGQVVVDTQDPNLRLRAEHAVWQISQNRIIADPQVQIQTSTAEATPGSAVADRAELDLAAKTITLGPKAQVSLKQPPLEVASQQLVWAPNQQTIASQQPLQVWHRDQEITLRASQGTMNLAQQQIQLTGKVQASGVRNQSVLKSNQLTWLLPSQKIIAQGNVFYAQNQPQLELQAPRAIGKIQAKTIMIQGENVVTEIFP